MIPAIFVAIAEFLGVSTEVVAASVIGGATGSIITAGLISAIKSGNPDRIKSEFYRLSPEDRRKLKEVISSI